MNTTGGSLGSGSFVSKDGQRNFDIKNESDVISLLKYVHQSPFEAELKNHFRDLIFSYRQSMSQGDLRLVADAFADIGVVIVRGDVEEVVQPVVEVKSPVSSLGSSRPKPRFSVQTKTVSVPVTSIPPQPQEVREVKKIPVTDMSTPVVTPMQSPVEQVPVASVQETPRIQTEVITPAPATEVVPPIATAPLINPTVRIQEIKREVNEKVGNPVNLISINNEIGREYMNALLDAMKKVNGGSQVEIGGALARLEKAFELVKTVDTSSLQSAKTEEAVREEPQHTSHSTMGHTPPTVPIPSYIETTDTAAASPLPQKEEPIPFIQREPVVPIQEMPRMSSVKERLQGEGSMPTIAPMPQASLPQEDGMHSVAKEKQLQDLLRLNQLKGAKAANDKMAAEVSGMDPLLTPEVTSGLDQLLSEWSLFKNSGIFGTGPSGNDHPLYKKISPLTMAAVIAGRFEGATPAIKQSITDYMNGWRYEEGIVHEHGETFEHYLRRVVRHILSKQKMR